MTEKKSKRNTVRKDSTPAGESITASVEKCLAATESIQRMGRIIKRDLRRCERLQKKINAALGKQLFLPGQSATSRKNLRRFKIFFEILKSLMMLKIELIKQLMRIHGVNPSNPSEMWRIAEIAAAGMLTPAVPAMTRSPGMPSERAVSSQPPYSEEAVRLATYLTKRAHSRKPFTMESKTDRRKNHQERSGNELTHEGGEL
jgi:hypothetical protein